MNTKRTLFTGFLALLAVSTAYAAYNFSGGDFFQGRLAFIFQPPVQDSLNVAIEMPASDYEDYSYKHPVMFRARVGSLKSVSPERLQYRWESDKQGLVGETFEFEQKLSKGNHLITCTVTDGNGNRGTGSRYVNIINTAPVVSIKSPADTISVKEGQQVLLDAEIIDNEERTIPEVAISWKSNLEGDLGRGKTLLIDTFTPGTHKITLTARDSEGEESVASINIIVQ